VEEGGSHGIDAEVLAAGEQEVVSCGQLSVEPDVDIDDGHPHQLLQTTEIGQSLPLLRNLLLQNVNCIHATTFTCLHIGPLAPARHCKTGIVPAYR